jgi:hypothetical protein
MTFNEQNLGLTHWVAFDHNFGGFPDVIIMQARQYILPRLASKQGRDRGDTLP